MKNSQQKTQALARFRNLIKRNLISENYISFIKAQRLLLGEIERI